MALSPQAQAQLDRNIKADEANQQARLRKQVAAQEMKIAELSARLLRLTFLVDEIIGEGQS